MLFGMLAATFASALAKLVCPSDLVWCTTII
jgi:hypothetical protein